MAGDAAADTDRVGRGTGTQAARARAAANQGAWWPGASRGERGRPPGSQGWARVLARSLPGWPASGGVRARDGAAWGGGR